MSHGPFTGIVHYACFKSFGIDSVAAKQAIAEENIGLLENPSDLNTPFQIGFGLLIENILMHPTARKK